MTTCYRKIMLLSPINAVYVVADDESLKAISFENNWQKTRKQLGVISTGDNPIIEQTKDQLREYFDGKRSTFDLPLSLPGTEFQQQCWQFLQSIPYGETRSYSEQAASIGNPRAVRGVGSANGLNPIVIVVPCHRVIGKSGKLSGYGGGLSVKEFLLELEKRHTAEREK